MARVGVDIDGVLANFVSGFADLIKRMTGKDVPHMADSWDWYRAHGVTAADEKELWAYIRAHPEFWVGLAPLRDAREGGFAALERWHRNRSDIYFITSRPGVGAKTATEEWLEKVLSFPPTVLLVGGAVDKAKAADALNLTHFVDDRPENIVAVRTHVPRCRAALYTASYNEGEELPVRVHRLEELL